MKYSLEKNTPKPGRGNNNNNNSEMDNVAGSGLLKSALKNGTPPRGRGESF